MLWTRQFSAPSSGNEREARFKSAMSVGSRRRKTCAGWRPLEQALLAKGHRNFRMVVVGQGRQEMWLRNNMKHAEFTGLLRGTELSRVVADMDILAFPSETDTFGLVVLEAFASGVPAVVTASGGPKYTVQHGRTGYVAHNFDEFAAFYARH